jgi:hypothetical protein
MNAVQSNIVYYNELYSVRSGIAPNPVNADQGILNIAMDGIENETPFHILTLHIRWQIVAKQRSQPTQRH